MQTENNEIKNNTDNNQKQKSMFGEDEELPWEENEHEKELLKQSFISKYWMSIILLVLLLILPFTILNIKFTPSKTNSTSTNTSSGSSLNNVDFAPYPNMNYLSEIYNGKWYGNVTLFNQSNKKFNITKNNTLISVESLPYDFLKNFSTIYVYSYNTKINNSISNTNKINLIGYVYMTLYPKKIYSGMKNDFNNQSLNIYNASYYNMTYSIQEQNTVLNGSLYKIISIVAVKGNSVLWFGIRFNDSVVNYTDANLVKFIYNYK